jgi:hypothetical protein
MSYLIDFFAPIIVMIIIFAMIIMITMKINKLMIGNKIIFLENKKLTLRISHILIFLYLIAILFGYFQGFVYYWYDFISFSFSIFLIFAIGKYTPGLIAHLRQLHQSNLEDAKEQELREIE